MKIFYNIYYAKKFLMAYKNFLISEIFTQKLFIEYLFCTRVILGAGSMSMYRKLRKNIQGINSSEGF